MIIALLGDVEGDRDVAVARLREIGERGDVEHVCQLGDLRFGMGSHPEQYLAALEAACADFGLRLWCVPGNHENWAELDRRWAQPSARGHDGVLLPLPLSEHVMMLPRGHRWEWAGRSFLALGGAPSLNRHRLTEVVDWWPTEILTDTDVEAATAGGSVSVMLTHDSADLPYCTEPVATILRENRTTNPREWPEKALAYAQEGLNTLTRAVLEVRPRFLAHGHFHVAGEAVVRLPGAERATTIWSLAALHDAGNLRYLDLDTLAEAAAEPA